MKLCTIQLREPSNMSPVVRSGAGGYGVDFDADHAPPR
jgi:hypothetical protein